jgi:hypothetical protein
MRNEERLHRSDEEDNDGGAGSSPKGKFAPPYS